jgi:hypothetical protein
MSTSRFADDARKITIPGSGQFISDEQHDLLAATLREFPARARVTWPSDLCEPTVREEFCAGDGG